MIKVDNSEINLEGIFPTLITELGIAACEIIIGTMRTDGITKEKAIKLLYMGLQTSIETYEREGKL